MSITKHLDVPDKTPAPTESPFPGYPLGVWPPLISAFCALSMNNLRHHDCSMPGCTCPCHSTRQAHTMQDMEWEAISGNSAIDEGIERLHRLEKLGSNRNGTRVPPRK